MANAPYLENRFSMINFRVNVEFSTENSLRQAEKQIGKPIASPRITGYFKALENPHPRAQILLSCDSKHGKIPFDWL